MAKSVNQQAVKFLNALRKVAVQKEITVTEAVKLLLDEMPDLTRSETYNSAEQAGINKLTARNVYDNRQRNVH